MVVDCKDMQSLKNGHLNLDEKTKTQVSANNKWLIPEMTYVSTEALNPLEKTKIIDETVTISVPTDPTAHW